MEQGTGSRERERRGMRDTGGGDGVERRAVTTEDRSKWLGDWVTRDRAGM
jgi:hypothetical protein